MPLSDLDEVQLAQIAAMAAESGVEEAADEDYADLMQQGLVPGAGPPRPPASDDDADGSEDVADEDEGLSMQLLVEGSDEIDTSGDGDSEE